MEKDNFQVQQKKHNLVIYITNLSGRSVPFVWRRRCSGLVKRCFALTKIISAEVSLVFVKPQLIKKLNLRFHKKNKVTDVLSFVYQSNKKEINGEILICLNQARQQASKHRHPLIKELSILVAHGALHLAGYDHQLIRQRQVMDNLQKRILN